MRHPRRDPWRDPRRDPWRLSRQCTEECIARTRRDLAVVAARPGSLPEVWKVVEQELLEELVELEFSLCAGREQDIVPDDSRRQQTISGGKSVNAGGIESNNMRSGAPKGSLFVLTGAGPAIRDARSLGGERAGDHEADGSAGG